MYKTICIPFLALVISSCHSRKKIISEYKSADTIQQMNVSVMQRTASDSSCTWSLQQLFSRLSVDIDSIVITREPGAVTVDPGELTPEGSALQAVAHHDHPGMAMECYYAGNRLAVGEADTTFKTASIPRPPPGASSPVSVAATPKRSKERIVIAGLRISKDDTATVASVTESKDTVSEAAAEVGQEKEVSTQEHKVVEKREPASAAGLKILIVIAGIIIAIVVIRRFLFRNKV